MKNKIIAIFVVMTLIAISFSVVQAGEIQKIEKKDKTIPVEIVAITEDRTSTSETFLLSEDQIVELETFFATITQQMESTSSWDDIEDIIDKIQVNNGSISDIISKIIKRIKHFIIHIIAKIKLYFARGFVVSFGHSYKFNPFKKSEINLNKKFTMWRYSNKAIIKDRTIIFKMIKDPRAVSIKILKGMQFGFMVNFFGLYIHFARKLPTQSTTFILGTARYINGLQLSLK